MGNLLQVRELCVQYRSLRARPHLAVDRINFDIGPGEVVGLMGESGCGKTTIALGLLRLLPKDNVKVLGTISFRGQNLLAMEERALERIRGAEISMVYQEPGISLCPVLGVGDQVAEVFRAHRNWSWEQCRTEAGSMLTLVGLPGTARIFSAYPHQLSGGQLQRVVLAQALACRPALLVADEPTASLDARSQADFLLLLGELKQQFGLAILLISHTPEIQATLADRLLVMKEGWIVEEGSFEQIYRNPTHAYTRTLFGRSGRARKIESSPADLIASRNNSQ
jgi:ABC-type glutathione transport system ATPase component